MPIRQGIRMKTKYTRKDFNAAHQVCFANLRTLRGKPRGVLTRGISTKIKKECRLHSSLVLVERSNRKSNKTDLYAVDFFPIQDISIQ